MSIVRIGIQTRSLRLPLRRALAKASELGAEGVEIDLRSELPLADLSQTALRQFRKLLDDYSLRVSAVAYPTRRGYDEPSDLERRLLGTQRAMKAAADLGAKVVINSVANDIPAPNADNDSADDNSANNNSPTDVRRQTLLQSLTFLATEGNRVGAQLSALTTGAPAEDLAQLIGELPEGTLGVSLHPAHLLASGQSPVEAMESLGPYLTHVHACDAVKELGASRMMEVELGRGSTDMPALFGALEANQYRGWITIEQTGASQPAIPIGNAVTYLRNLRG